MPFVQFSLDKSINQSRNIFDKYLYSPNNGDTKADMIVPGYFSSSRFANDPGWVGGLIEALASDGLIILQLSSIGTAIDMTPLPDVDRVVVVRGTDFTDQLPTALDTPMQVTFGAGSGTGADPVNIDALGNININVADNYHFRLSSQFGRTGSGGTAFLWQRVLVNGAQAGVSVLAKLNNANSDFPYQAELTADLPAGVTVTVELWRGSAGTNDGGYFSIAPLLPGANSGFSADVIVSRYMASNA